MGALNWQEMMIPMGMGMLAANQPRPYNQGPNTFGSVVGQGGMYALENYAEMNKRKTPIEVNGRLIDPDTYEVIKDFSKPGNAMSGIGKIKADVASGILTPEEGKTMIDKLSKSTTRDLIGSASPSDFTPKSLFNYQTSGDPRTLVYRNKPVDKPATVAEVEWLQNQPKEIQDQYWNAKRAGHVFDTGTGFAYGSPQNPSEATSVVDAEGNPVTQEVPTKDTAEHRAKVKAAELEEERISTIKTDAPQQKNRLQSLNSQWTEVDSRIDTALKKVSPYTTGFGGLLAFLPQSEARALKNDLETIRANIGFDKLQDMRANSKTGGALGQVSDLENKLLQAVNGALDQLDKGENITNNLKLIQTHLRNLRKDTNDSFVRDYSGSSDNEGWEDL